MPVLKFRYPSVGGNAEQNQARLQAFLDTIDVQQLHLVGHSLGGVLIHRLLETKDSLPPGRVVLLGAPVRGSAAARGLSDWPIGRRMLGPCVAEALLEKQRPQCVTARQVGVLAGTGGVGLGRFFSELETPHDGTVSVAETDLPGAADRVELPVTHSGMLFSEDVARYVAHFIQSGRFAN